MYWLIGVCGRLPQALPAKKAKETLGSAKCYPVDPFVMRKYTGLCETYGFAG